MYVRMYLQYFSCTLSCATLPPWPSSLAQHLVTSEEVVVQLAVGIACTAHVDVPHEATGGGAGRGAGRGAKGQGGEEVQLHYIRDVCHSTHDQSYPR